MSNFVLNPAERAAAEARARVYECLDNGKSFLVEAGAGAGKTESLIKALRHLIEKRGADLLRRNQQVACITYTKVATEEIRSRTDGHPAIHSSTIHAFCWKMIRDFQPQLRKRLPLLQGWQERLEEAGGIGERRIDYELGHPRATKEDQQISLGHNDVLSLTIALMEQQKFRKLLAARFPILLIDEYQDTNNDFATAIKNHFLDAGEGPLIGFFGDHWQKIYGDGCGKLEHSALEIIGQKANFRSVPVIVEVLNRMRPELPQEVTDPDAEGLVTVYHTNDWSGKRLTGQHWGGDLPPDLAQSSLDTLRKQLATEGWSYDGDQTKILILTHRVLAAIQGYSSFLEIFPHNDAFLEQKDPHIAFLLKTLEPVCTAYENKRYGDMFAVLGGHTPAIQSRADKMSWAADMNALIELRSKGTIGEVLDHLRRTKRPRLPERLEKSAIELEQLEEGTICEQSLEQLRKLRGVSYQEIIALKQFIDEHTPYSTKHGVKGAQFENVLVVFGRGWNQYDFNQMLEWEGTNVPSGREPFRDRNRNLFYVVCSRPKKRLALLFTQELSNKAMGTLANWFGAEAIQPLQI